MRKLYFIALIVAIPLVILGASHAHTLASEDYTNLDHHKNADNLPEVSPMEMTQPDFKFDKVNGLDLDFTLPVDCSSGFFTFCEQDVSIMMYVKDIDDGNSVRKHLDNNGNVNFSWDEVKKYKERAGANSVKFGIAGTFNFQLIGQDTTKQMDISLSKFSIKDSKLSDPEIAICKANGIDKTIYKSQWNTYESEGAKKGTCASQDDKANFGG